MSGSRQQDGRYMERTVQATTPDVQEDEEGRLSYSTSTGDAVEMREACYEPGCQRQHVQHADERLHADE